MRHFWRFSTTVKSKANYKVLIITCPSKYTWTIDWRKLKIEVVRTEWNVRFFKCLTCFSICRLKRILRQLDGAYSDSFFLGSDFDQWLWEEPFPDGIDMDKAQVLRRFWLHWKLCYYVIMMWANFPIYPPTLCPVWIFAPKMWQKVWKIHFSNWFLKGSGISNYFIIEFRLIPVGSGMTIT